MQTVGHAAVRGQTRYERASDESSDSVSRVTEEDARQVAFSLLSERLPEFKAGEWVLTDVEEFDTAWAYSYNSRAYVETREVSHALAGNGALVVPKSGDEPWFTWSGADTASQVGRGRSALEP